MLSHNDNSQADLSTARRHDATCTTLLLLLLKVILLNTHLIFSFIRPDSHRKKCKTAIKWRTLNPTFNEEFSFETRPSEMDKQTLYISVWDKDIGKSDDFLGSLIIGHNSKGNRLKQWRGNVFLKRICKVFWFVAWDNFNSRQRYH